MQWDIIVRTRWTYGHIAIIDHILNWRVYVLEQNGSWKNSWNGVGENAIRVKDYSISWFEVVLRNERIIKNYENELRVVEEKIKEYEGKIRVTREYERVSRISQKINWNYCNNKITKQVFNTMLDIFILKKSLKFDF
jgi:hypothetical protein